MVCILVGSHWSKDAEEGLVLSSFSVLEKKLISLSPNLKRRNHLHQLICRAGQQQSRHEVEDKYLDLLEGKGASNRDVEVGKQVSHLSGKSFSSAHGRR